MLQLPVLRWGEPYTSMDVDEVKHFLTEYCGELLHTPEFKNDANAGYKKVFERFQRDYGFGKPDFKMYKPKGCDACGGSGYSGRFAMHEVLPVTDRVADAITEWAPPAEIARDTVMLRSRRYMPGF